jgi:medium-chain acyl-[acyl-carrier-protein] hydrolase
MKPSPWFVPLRESNGSKIRLVCFHSAGGHANNFRSWVTSLPKEIDVIGIELPGRGRRFSEPLVQNYIEVVDPLLSTFATTQDKPLILYGHSLGAILAYELVRALSDRQMRIPLALIVAACAPPHVLSKHIPISELRDSEFVAALRDYNGTKEEVFEHDELVNLVLPMLRADFRMGEKYPRGAGAPAVSCPITAVGADQDRWITSDEIYAWRQMTSAKFSARIISGDHFFSGGGELISNIREIVMQHLN